MRSNWSSFTSGQKAFLLGWAASLIAASSLALLIMGGEQQRNLRESIARHSARVSSGSSEHGQTEPATSPPPGHEHDVPREVRVGVYVDRIPQFSIIDSSWTADFYVWFNWEGADLDPGETFQIVNGDIAAKRQLEKTNVGNRYYALYRVTGTITKSFDVARFPRDDHMLTIGIEDTVNQSYQLRYVADEKGSDVSSRVTVPGYGVRSHQASVRPHSYKTSRGNPGLPTSYKATYSQFVYGVWVSRPTWGLHFKMFVVLFGAVFIAFLGSFVSSSGDRLSLVTGALFATLANMYTTAGLIPNTGVRTLADEINWLGAGFVFAAMVQAVIYEFALEKREELAGLARFYDRMSFLLMVVLYAVVNLLIPVLASV
jgi:hypothetical protein